MHWGDPLTFPRRTRRRIKGPSEEVCSGRHPRPCTLGFHSPLRHFGAGSPGIQCMSSKTSVSLIFRGLHRSHSALCRFAYLNLHLGRLLRLWRSSRRLAFRQWSSRLQDEKYLERSTEYWPALPPQCFRASLYSGRTVVVEAPQHWEVLYILMLRCRCHNFG